MASHPRSASATSKTRTRIRPKVRTSEAVAMFESLEGRALLSAGTFARWPRPSPGGPARVAPASAESPRSAMISARHDGP